MYRRLQSNGKIDEVETWTPRYCKMLLWRDFEHVLDRTKAKRKGSWWGDVNNLCDDFKVVKCRVTWRVN